MSRYSFLPLGWLGRDVDHMWRKQYDRWAGLESLWFPIKQLLGKYLVIYSLSSRTQNLHSSFWMKWQVLKTLLRTIYICQRPIHHETEMNRPVHTSGHCYSLFCSLFPGPASLVGPREINNTGWGPVCRVVGNSTRTVKLSKSTHACLFPHIQTALYKKVHRNDIHWVIYKNYILFLWSCNTLVVVSFQGGWQKSVFKGRTGEGESLQQDAGRLPLETTWGVRGYHFPGTGTPHSYQPTNGWGVRRPMTPNVTGSCL